MSKKTKIQHPKKNPECVWAINFTCSGPVKDRALSQPKAIRIPCCWKHYTEHLTIIFLAKHGVKINSILKHGVKWREEQRAQLKAKGIK